MKHFKLNKTQRRMSRIANLINMTFDLVGDQLKILAIRKRLDSAYSHLSSRHHKRANVQLTMALALLKGL